MGTFDDLRRRYQPGAETAPLDKSRFTAPLKRSSAVEQEGMEVDDKQNIMALLKAIRRVLKDPGRYPLAEVQENINSYLANMAESWGAIRADVLEEGTINTDLEEQTDPEKLGASLESALVQLLAIDKRQVSKWQVGNHESIRLIDSLLTSYSLLGNKGTDRINLFIKKLHGSNSKY